MRAPRVNSWDRCDYSHGDRRRNRSRLAASSPRRSRIRIDVEIESDLPLVVLDRVQVRQVVNNLIRNGMEAMDFVARLRAEETIADVDASGLWPGKVVTQVVPGSDFWEPEHQDYLERIQ
jgi:hypothetical protein